MKRILWLCLIAGLPALADIKTTGLYNTGVGANGQLLAAGAIDPHYQLVTYPTGTIFANPGGSVTIQPGQATVIDAGWPISPGVWVPNTLNSQWIGPREDAANGEPPQPPGQPCTDNCYYDYRLTFTVSSLGDLVGRMWTSDNGGFIVVNSVSRSLTDAQILNPANAAPGTNTGAGVDQGTYRSWHEFTISQSDLQEGQNTLDFVVQNWGTAAGYSSNNPTGLHVNFPEPGALLLMGVMGGALILAGVLRRKLT